MYRVRKFENKYKNVKTEVNGITYHSKLEGKYAFELNARKLAGEIKDWERKVRISLDVGGRHICNYYIDFLIHHLDETKEYVEVKGFQTDVWRLKWKLFEALYSELPMTRLTIVK
jgi:hypothetical protein